MRISPPPEQPRFWWVVTSCDPLHRMNEPKRRIFAGEKSRTVPPNLGKSRTGHQKTAMALVVRRCVLIFSAVAQVLLIGSLAIFWLQLLWGGWVNSSDHPSHHPSLGATAGAVPSWVSTAPVHKISPPPKELRSINIMLVDKSPSLRMSRPLRTQLRSNDLFVSIKSFGKGVATWTAADFKRSKQGRVRDLMLPPYLNDRGIFCVSFRARRNGNGGHLFSAAAAV